MISFYLTNAELCNKSRSLCIKAWQQEWLTAAPWQTNNPCRHQTRSTGWITSKPSRDAHTRENLYMFWPGAMCKQVRHGSAHSMHAPPLCPWYQVLTDLCPCTSPQASSPTRPGSVAKAELIINIITSIYEIYQLQNCSFIWRSTFDNYIKLSSFVLVEHIYKCKCVAKLALVLLWQK